MEQLQALWSQFGAAHPIYSHAIAFLGGVVLMPRLVAWFDAKGIPKLVDWADEHQKVILARAGLSPEAIIAVRKHEVLDLRKTADELEENIKNEEAALAGLPQAPKPSGS